jgi:hypothetical protein
MKLDEGELAGAIDGAEHVEPAFGCPLLRCARILRLQRQREGGLYRSPNAVSPLPLSAA